eukprot:11171129-Lingulodinium_polyedra.AAC.1
MGSARAGGFARCRDGESSVRLRRFAAFRNCCIKARGCIVMSTRARASRLQAWFAAAPLVAGPKGKQPARGARVAARGQSR